MVLPYSAFDSCRRQGNGESSSSLVEPEIRWAGLVWVFLTPALGGLIYGFDIGATSVVILLLLFQNEGATSIIGPDHERDGSGDDGDELLRVEYSTTSLHRLQEDTAISWWSDPSVSFQTSTWQQGLVVAAVSLGAMAGSHLSFCYSECIGRRMELRMAALLYMIGAAANVLSGTVFRDQGCMALALLILGRLIFGAGVGLVMHGAPTYLAEMTPTVIRGAVVSAKETVIVFGILLGYWAGDACSRSIVRGGAAGMENSATSSGHISDYINDGAQWTQLYAVSAVMAIPMLALTFVIPRSLRWLLSQGEQYRDEAYQSMRFVYKGDEGDVLEAFLRLEAQIANHRISADSDIPVKPLSLSLSPLKQQDKSKHDHTLSRLFSPTLWPSFRAAMGLIVLQQFSGQPSVLSFSAVLFHMVGWNGRASTVTAFVMLCVSTATVFTVDRVGRKRLLYLCCTVLAVAASMLSYQFWDLKTGNERPAFTATGKIVVLMAMFGFIGGYQIGFGPITWLVVSEVFPGDVRGAATALGVELNYMLNFLVQFLVPIAKDRIGWGPTFGMYASIMVFGVSFVHLYVPETAGLTLEAIEDQLTLRQLQECDDIDEKDDDDKLWTNEHSPLVADSTDREKTRNHYI